MGVIPQNVGNNSIDTMELPAMSKMISLVTESAAYHILTNSYMDGILEGSNQLFNNTNTSFTPLRE